MVSCQVQYIMETTKGKATADLGLGGNGILLLRVSPPTFLADEKEAFSVMFFCLGATPVKWPPVTGTSSHKAQAYCFINGLRNVPFIT